MEDIVPYKKEAARLVDELVIPVRKAEGNRQRFLNEWRDKVRALDLSQKESEWVQMFGEGEIGWAAIPEASREKVRVAVKTMRDEIYPKLLDIANDVLVENGYHPTRARKDYFPHFSDPDDPIVKALGKLGIHIDLTQLPTDIAGTTHKRHPGKQWFSSFLQRKGTDTVFDAVRGFDQYLEGISNVLYHTDNIKRFRAFEDAVRYKYSDPGVRERIKEIRASEMSVEEQNGAIEGLREKLKQSHLPKFVTYLQDYTDGLAGKKALADRSTEHSFSRIFYSVTKAMEGRVSSNMVALNPASWLTNFIPLTQAGDIKTINLLKGMWGAVAQHGKNAGEELRAVMDASDFLAGRRGSQPLARTGLEKVQDVLTAPMGWIDDFTSSAIVRAKYLDNMEKGMTHADALKNADDYAGRLIADRSKGMLPTVFNRKNPVAKVLTMYQVEVNNQFSFLLKDLPKQEAKYRVLAAAAALTKYAVGAYIFNDVYERVVGRRPAFDPLGMINEAVGDASGMQLPNLTDVISDAVDGEWNGFSTGQEGSWKKAGVNLATSAVESVPFVGGLIGGGRVPISSALPNVGNMWGAVAGLADGDMAKETAIGKLGKELAKPLAYLVPPIGGGQAKKTIEGLYTMSQGGSYGLTKEGERQLKFMVDPTVGNYVKSALFGQYATPDGQAYIKSGFKPALSVKETAAMELSGVEPRVFLELAERLGAQKADKDAQGKEVLAAAEKKRRLLMESGLTPEQKTTIDREMLSGEEQEKRRGYASPDDFILSGLSEENQKRWKMPGVSEAVGDARTYAEILSAQSKVESEKDRYGNAVTGSAEKKKITEIARVMGTDEAQASRVYDELFVEKHSIEEFSSEAQQHFERVSSATGMKPEEFVGYMEVLREVTAGEGGSLAQARVQALVDAGYTPKQADEVVRDLFITKYAVDELEEGPVEAFGELQTKYGLSERAFLKYYNLAQPVQGKKGANGKTISGSVKKARFRALVAADEAQGTPTRNARANAKAVLVALYGYKNEGWE